MTAESWRQKSQGGSSYTIDIFRQEHFGHSTKMINFGYKVVYQGPVSI